MTWLVFWFICGVAAAMIGATKGSGVAFFFGGILFGPLGVLAAVLDEGNRKRCPSCRELTRPDATVCPHCQRAIP